MCVCACTRACAHVHASTHTCTHTGQEAVCRCLLTAEGRRWSPGHRLSLSGKVKLVEGVKFKKQKAITRLEGWSVRPAELWDFMERGCGSLGLPQIRWLAAPLTVSIGLSGPVRHAGAPSSQVGHGTPQTTANWSELGVAWAPGSVASLEVRVWPRGVCISSRQRQH